MLIRRAIRKTLMQSMGLRANNIESHVNGSVTVGLSLELGSMTQQDALLGFVETLRAKLTEANFEVQPISAGVKGSVVWVRFTNSAMRAEAQQKYNHSVPETLIRTWEGLEEAIRNTATVQQVVAEAANPATEAESTPITEPIFEIPEPTAEDAAALATLEPSEV